MLSRADILVGSLRSGDASSQHTFDLVRVLQARGVEVRIYGTGRLAPLPSHIRKLTQWTFPGDYIPDADTTILQYPLWFPLAERFREASGTRIFWYHGVTPPELWGTPSERDLLERSQIGAELAWHAHLVVADSPFGAAELAGNSGYPAEHTRVVPLGLKVDSFQANTPEPVLNRLRRRWGLQDRRIVLAVGRVAGNKRIDLLVEALSKLSPQYPDLHLLLVGEHNANASEQELTAQLQRQIDELGLSTQVTFTGRVEEVVPYYHLAEVYAIASQHEGFGVPVVEAMAAGVPVLASASGAMPWVLGAGEDSEQPAGLTFQPGDANHLAIQIRRLLDDHDLRATLIERGRQRVQIFNKTKFAEHASGILDEAQELARQGPPPAAHRAVDPLVRKADIALRNYRVRSDLPVFGRLLAWLRSNSTTHIKEAYLDRIIEQQVTYNRLLAEEIIHLRAQLRTLEARLAQAEHDETYPEADNEH